MNKRIFSVVLVLAICLFATGCTEAERQTVALSKKADNFEKTRIVTVINTRNGEVIFRMKGTFSCQYSNGDLDIISSVGPDEYQKHFIHLTDNLTYVVEDTEGDGDLYYQKIEYFPERELVMESS